MRVLPTSGGAENAADLVKFLAKATAAMRSALINYWVQFADGTFADRTEVFQYNSTMAKCTLDGVVAAVQKMQSNLTEVAIVTHIFR